jgi:hypothetical protein
MDKGISEKTVSEDKGPVKIATIVAVAKAIKENAEFRYNGINNNVCGNIGL